MLVNQFVSGLQSELQAKVVGVEGGMDEIVTKAQFEEAKLKELSGRSAGPREKRTYPPKGGHANRVLTPPTSSTQPMPADQGEQSRDRRGKKSVTCFQYGMDGHMRSNCPYPRAQREGTESHGRQQVKNITSQESSVMP